ncbi:hypothetical protein A9G27_11385 [Gilliamella sp. Bim3-2]|nr:hypothetical protein A9G32_07490 [Gilliamella apicola]OCG51744.1 hypothetical protein A9G27_11385 [Gilliamella apicola]
MNVKLIYYFLGVISCVLGMTIDVWLGVPIPTYFVRHIYCIAFVAGMLLLIFIFINLIKVRVKDGRK